MRARGLVAAGVRWSAGTGPPCGTALAVRIRHRHLPIPCRIVGTAASEAVVAFDAPGPAVTPGQAAVFYDGEYVLGGGWIVGEAA
jgi:tRNA-specific 2-thiouridylase